MRGETLLQDIAATVAQEFRPVQIACSWFRDTQLKCKKWWMAELWQKMPRTVAEWITCMQLWYQRRYMKTIETAQHLQSSPGQVTTLTSMPSASWIAADSMKLFPDMALLCILPIKEAKEANRLQQFATKMLLSLRAPVMKCDEITYHNQATNGTDQVCQGRECLSTLRVLWQRQKQLLCHYIMTFSVATLTLTF